MPVNGGVAVRTTWGEIGGKGIIGKLQVVAVALRQGQSRPDTGSGEASGRSTTTVRSTTTSVERSCAKPHREEYR